MRGAIVGIVWSSLGLVAGCAPPPRAIGAVCGAGPDCPAGLCEDIGIGSLACTQPCDAAAPCPDPWVCGPDGRCVAACMPGMTMGAGATRRVCVGDVFTACSSLDPVAYCASCGCDPFGGGVCIAGRGCVPPAPDGTSCTVDGECMSGLCYSDTRVCGVARADGEPCGAATDCASPRCFADTGTCGPLRADGEPCTSAADCAADSCLSDRTCGDPRAMGGACLIDADCSTQNCSTNGISATPGVCFQRLGTSCERTTTTCQRCLGADALSSGICTRDRCDPTDAPNCPTYMSHRWECVESTMAGEYYCFERCLPEEDGETRFHRCFDVFDSCSSGGSFCR